MRPRRHCPEKKEPKNVARSGDRISPLSPPEGRAKKSRLFPLTSLLSRQFFSHFPFSIFSPPATNAFPSVQPQKNVGGAPTPFFACHGCDSLDFHFLVVFCRCFPLLCGFWWRKMILLSPLAEERRGKERKKICFLVYILSQKGVERISPAHQSNSSLKNKI